MSSISIVGVGTMARAIGARAVAAGVDVQVIGRDAAKTDALAAELGATAGTPDTVLTGAIVVLAVPYTAAAPTVAGYGDALAGKVVVDITNPFDTATPTDLVAPADSSGAQEIAKVAPAGAHVVKAFNTLFAGILTAGEVEGHPVDVFIAGDDAGAKAVVAEFVKSLGLRPLDTGDLKMARWLEGAGLLVLGQAARSENFSLTIKVLG